MFVIIIGWILTFLLAQAVLSGQIFPFLDFVLNCRFFSLSIALRRLVPVSGNVKSTTALVAAASHLELSVLAFLCGLRAPSLVHVALAQFVAVDQKVYIDQYNKVVTQFVFFAAERRPDPFCAIGIRAGL